MADTPFQSDRDLHGDSRVGAARRRRERRLRALGRRLALERSIASATVDHHSYMRSSSAALSACVEQMRRELADLREHVRHLDAAHTARIGQAETLPRPAHPSPREAALSDASMPEAWREAPTPRESDDRSRDAKRSRKSQEPEASPLVGCWQLVGDDGVKLGGFAITPPAAQPRHQLLLHLDSHEVSLELQLSGEWSYVVSRTHFVRIRAAQAEGWLDVEVIPIDNDELRWHDFPHRRVVMSHVVPNQPQPAFSAATRSAGAPAVTSATAAGCAEAPQP